MTVKVKTKKVRTLEDICDVEDFSLNVLGNTYCNLSMSRKIQCKFQAPYKDQNKLYACLNPKYNIMDYYKTKQQ